MASVCFWARTDSGLCFTGLADGFLAFLHSACPGSACFNGSNPACCIVASGYYDCNGPIPCACSNPDCATDPNFNSCGGNPLVCVPCCPPQVQIPTCPPGQIGFCPTPDGPCICIDPTVPPPPPPPPPPDCSSTTCSSSEYHVDATGNCNPGDTSDGPCCCIPKGPLPPPCPPPGFQICVNGVCTCQQDPPLPSHLPRQLRLRVTSVKRRIASRFRPSTLSHSQPNRAITLKTSLNPSLRIPVPIRFKSCECGMEGEELGMVAELNA